MTAKITEGADVMETSPVKRLVGGICLECDTVGFPLPEGCSRCAGTSIARHLLPATGTLWTYTVQRIEPKEPFFSSAAFVPFAVGYVDLDGEVLVEGRILEDPSRELSIGMPMQTVVVDLGPDREGQERTTFGFAPVGAVR